MTRAQARNIIDSLRRQHVNLNVLHITGGEPALNPDLVWMIREFKASGMVQQVHVQSNGVDRTASDFGEADVVRVTHYGAINRDDILRLRRELRGRLDLACTVHVKWPYPQEGKIPADCSCAFLTFVDDRVYPCGFYGTADNEGSLPVSSDYHKEFSARNPRMQEKCKVCLANKTNPCYWRNPMTWEFGIWDTRIQRMGSLPLRKLLSGPYRLWKKATAWKP